MSLPTPFTTPNFTASNLHRVSVSIPCSYKQITGNDSYATPVTYVRQPVFLQQVIDTFQDLYKASQNSLSDTDSGESDESVALVVLERKVTIPF